jgi:hypothetical protein
MAHEWIAMGSGQGLIAKVHEWLVWFWGQDVSDNGIKPVVCILFVNPCLLAVSIACGIASMLLLGVVLQSPTRTTFSCPLVPLVPLIGIAANTYMMGSLPALSWAFTCVWLLLGNAVYFLYGIRHSRLGKQQPPLRMLSMPEATPLTNGEEGLGSYESTATGGLEHRTHLSTQDISLVSS